MFDPRDHYWLAEDGRLFGSARGRIVSEPETDAAFGQWQETGRAPTPWPRDESHNQTIAALQAVLSPYGLFADLVAYASDLRWRTEVGGITIAGIPIATDDRAKMMIVGARVAAAADPDWTTIWHGTDGGNYPINAPSMVAISDLVEAHVNATFATFAIVKAEIEAGQITTTAEIDAAFV